MVADLQEGSIRKCEAHRSELRDPLLPLGISLDDLMEGCKVGLGYRGECGAWAVHFHGWNHLKKGLMQSPPELDVLLSNSQGRGSLRAPFF